MLHLFCNDDIMQDPEVHDTHKDEVQLSLSSNFHLILWTIMRFLVSLYNCVMSLIWCRSQDWGSDKEGTIESAKRS